MKIKKDVSGLVFSAFLVIAYVICSYFFMGIIENSNGMETSVKLLLKCLVYIFFGLILFYATRVGDGKQVKRFSFSVLLFIDLPALYIILSACAVGLPFPLDLAAVPETVSIAAAALGYAIPYTFLSGYELDRPKAVKKETPVKNEIESAEEDSDDTDEISEDTDEDINETTENTNEETTESYVEDDTEDTDE